MKARIGIVLALILAAIFGLQVPESGSLRIAAMLPFMLLGPGIAWVAISDRLGAAGYAVVAISVSLACNILVATLLLFTQLWSPELGFWLLVFAAAFGLFITDREKEPQPA